MEKMPKEKVQFDWYTDLLGRLTDGLIKKADYSRISENCISFITFNYDRSLEHFMFESLINSFYGIAPEHIRRVLQEIPVIHVYGRVAPLDWQESCDGKPRIPYRMDVNAINVPDLIDNLHVVYDERCDPDLEKARELVSQAERVFFLGFGYAKENLEVLGLPDVLKTSQRIYGTALGCTPNEIGHVQDFFDMGLSKRGIRGFADSQVRILNRDCVRLLREFL